MQVGFIGLGKMGFDLGVGDRDFRAHIECVLPDLRSSAAETYKWYRDFDDHLTSVQGLVTRSVTFRDSLALTFEWL